MTSITTTEIITWLQENINQGTLIGFFASAVGGLLALNFSDSCRQFVGKRRVWWRLLAVCVIVLITLLFCDFSQNFSLWYFFPGVTITPILITLFPLGKTHVFVPGEKRKWWMFSTADRLYYAFTMTKLAGEEEKQEMYLRFLKFLNTKDIMPWEMADYYVPILEEIFQIGAINLVKEEIEKLEKIQPDNKSLLIYKAYVDNAEFRIDDMRAHLTAFLERTDLDQADKLLATLNMLCVADESNDRDLRNKCIAYAEDAYFNQKMKDPTLVFDLLFHYDNYDEQPDKVQRILNDIYNADYKSAKSLFDYGDMVFNHFRKHNDRVGQICAVEMIVQRLKETKDDNEKIRLMTNLSILRPLFNVNANWKEHSQMIFLDSQIYLNHSSQMAAMFITESLNILQQAEQVYHQFIPDQDYNRLLGEMKQAVAKWEPEIRQEIADTPREMLYKRKSLYMQLVEFVRVKHDGQQNFRRMQEEKMEIMELIISDCRYNGNIRELLHFLNVYCDDIITVHSQITEPGNSFEPSELREYEKKYEEYYKPLALKYMDEIETIVDAHRTNKTLNFYVLYLANYSMILGIKDKESYYLSLFESYKIETNYFNTVTQQMYYTIKGDVENAN